MSANGYLKVPDVVEPAGEEVCGHSRKHTDEDWETIYFPAKNKRIKSKMAADSLIDAPEEIWRKTFELYEVILKRKAKEKKQDKGKELIELDNW